MKPYSGHFVDMSIFNPTHNNYVVAVIILFISQVEFGFTSVQNCKNNWYSTVKSIIIPIVKKEAGQVVQDIASGVGVKSALKRGTKKAGKSLVRKSTTNKIMSGKERKRKRK